ncbi:MAG: 3-deoxy-manno-octulosonate cytidylyltransferase [Armatimonadetes bacterium]|nr:3-deoxy-manno-octulosonate cytidylyltransferase [Armatimonadota bacterium]MDE2206350.1 3-deoxy-manno-octulosonate cytidylyltransferase [Armatimonadota bacterium]
MTGDARHPSPGRVVGMIPARLAATRLPNKPLLDIGGRTMIEHVWRRVTECSELTDVVIATPDEAVSAAGRAFGATVVLTSPDHPSGTDRLAEAARLLGLDAGDLVVNIQGDEPLLEVEVVDELVRALIRRPAFGMASVMCPCPEEDLNNPACVKVVAALSGAALYFSRSRIPYERNGAVGVRVMQHVGLYAYRAAFLLRYHDLPRTPLEMTEGLEQLRVLEHGLPIYMLSAQNAPIGVDTPEDLARVRAILGESRS